MNLKFSDVYLLVGLLCIEFDFERDWIGGEIVKVGKFSIWEVFKLRCKGICFVCDDIMGGCSVSLLQKIGYCI